MKSKKYEKVGQDQKFFFRENKWNHKKVRKSWSRSDNEKKSLVYKNLDIETTK